MQKGHVDDEGTLWVETLITDESELDDHPRETYGDCPFTAEQKKEILAFYTHWKDPQPQAAWNRIGLSEQQRAVLRAERLLAVEKHGGFLLVECRRCKNLIIFDLAQAEEDTWSCADCDRAKFVYAFPVVENPAHRLAA